MDIEKPAELLSYLRALERIGPDEPVDVRALAGGVSNRTVLLTRPTGEAWVLKQALAKLRVAVDWYADPARIHREAMGLRWLSLLAPPGTIPGLIFDDPVHHVIAMEAVPQPHENWRDVLLAGRVEAGHIEQFGRLLGAIHRASSIRRAEVEIVFDDRSFFESLRLEPYYLYTASQVPRSAGFLEDLVEATRARRLAIVHGDYSPKNVLVRGDGADAGRLVLLDHEVIHFGDPAFDLGFSLTHLLSKAHHLRDHRDRFAEATSQYMRCYLDALGDVPWRDDLEPMAVRHTLACLLARVAGRSPVHYLSTHEQGRQQTAAVALMARPPVSVPELTAKFLERL